MSLLLLRFILLLLCLMMLLLLLMCFMLMLLLLNRVCEQVTDERRNHPRPARGDAQGEQLHAVERDTGAKRGPNETGKRV